MSSRYSTCEIADGDTKLTVRLRKWSVNKCISLLHDIGELAKAIGEDFKITQDMGASQMAQFLVQLGEEALKRVTRIIKESVEEPKLTEEQILEWDLEAYVSVLTKIIELNFTESLIKNFNGLKTVILNRVPESLVPKRTKSPVGT